MPGTTSVFVGRGTTSVFVGRREELGVLERTLQEVEGGEARAVDVHGEPGIGKSRLLAELARRAHERGLTVLAGRAAELERDLTFAPLVDAFAPVARADGAGAAGELGPEHRRELRSVLRRPGSSTETDAVAASGERHRMARAVRALLERLAAERPVALLLDDAHWADPASTDVLSLLLHRPPRARVLIALATRAGSAPQLEAALAAAEQDGAAVVLELGPLSAGVAGELLPGAGRATVHRLHRESGGNPFYLLELARATGSEVEGGGVERLIGVPRAVQAALARELAALPDEVRLVLEGAAVAGDPFEPELAAAAADIEEAVALRALDELLAVELVRAAGPPRRFRFRHPLVRRAVYEGSGAGWRLAAHARAAKALEARGSTPAERAHHAERAARPGDPAALDVLVTAADEVASLAPATAAGWYGAALRLLPDGADHDQRRLALLGLRGRALISAGRPGEARDVLRRVLAMLPREAREERVGLIEALADLESVWLGDHEEARRLLRAEREALGSAAPPLHARLTFALARERVSCADQEPAGRLAHEARTAARAAGDRVLEAEAAVTEADAAHCALRRADPAALTAADRKLDEAEALAGSLSDELVAERLQMLFWLGVARLFTGSFPAARSAADRGLSIARRTRQGLLAPTFLTLRGLVHEETGRLDEAEEEVEEALESALVSGNDQLTYWAALVAAWIALARGATESALSHAQTGRRVAGDVPWSQVGWTVADARLSLGDAQGALEALDEFGGVNPGLWTLDRARALEVQVRVLLALGRLEEAQGCAARAPAEAGGRTTGVFGAITARARAGVLLAREAAPEAARVALAGVRAAEEGHAPLWSGRCRTLAGEALAAAGRREEASRELRRASARLESCGAWAYRDAALRELRRLGERPRPRSSRPAPTGGERLTALSPREREVAALVADGATNAQIAARLELSERTVEKHVSSALRKLGVDSRTAIVRLLSHAHAHGWSTRR